MIEKLKKFRQSHFLLSIPVLASVLIYVYCFIFRTAVVGISEIKLGELYGFAAVVLAIVMLIIHKLWFRPEYRGSFRMDLLKEKSVLIPLVVCFAIDMSFIMYGWITKGVQLPSLATLALVLMAGIGEEVFYRVITMTIELRIWIRKGSYLPALVIASLVFGLGHLLNVFAGATLSMTILQVFETTAAGFFLGALFIRTGNILYSIFIHVSHDLFELMTFGSNAVNSQMISAVDFAFRICLMLVQIIITVWLLKGRKDEILAIWKERWSISGEEIE